MKKLVKTPLIKEQVNEISQLDQVQAKNGNLANANVSGVAPTGSVAVPSCHLNGSNSNSSTSNELANCLDNVNAQHQSNANDLNDERNDSNALSKRTYFIRFMQNLVY